MMKKPNPFMAESTLPAIKLAAETVPGFSEEVESYRRKMAIRCYSENTITNYLRHLAYVSISTGTLPQFLTKENLEEYMFRVKSDNDFSLSFYKHMVGGLSLFYSLAGIEGRLIELPSVKERYTLPVVLSRKEVRKMIHHAGDIKTRVLIMLLYSAGLRAGEAESLRWADIDFDRKKIHVHAEKNRKDRVMELSVILAGELKRYRKKYSPPVYVLEGRNPGNKISKGSLQSAVRITVKSTGIEKRVSCHTLRHTFATHMLEDGYDILTIKELLGHVHIDHTLKYTHLAYVKRKKPSSPLDRIYKKRSPSFPGKGK